MTEPIEKITDDTRIEVTDDGQWVSVRDIAEPYRTMLLTFAFKEATLKELEEALNLVIPRCVKCFNYATKFNPTKLWPVCDAHILDAGGATQVVDYHNAIKATEALKKLKG